MPGSHIRRGHVVSVVLVAALAASGYGLWRAESRPPAPPPAPAPVPVEVAQAARRDVPVYLTGIGTVQPFNTVTVRSRVDGQLQQVLFKEGQDIRQGDLLAVIDPRTFEAALQQAQAKLVQDEASRANAQLILDRDTQLGKDAFASAQAVDNQRSTVQQLDAQIAQDKAAISTAQTQLSYTRITAPLDGRAGLRLVDEGNIVHATDTNGLVVINQLHPIAVISTLPQADVPAIRTALAKGTTQAQAVSREQGQTLATGTVELIDNKIDPQSGTLELKSVYANADDALWPGQFVEVRVRAATLPGVTTVPADAVQRGPSGEFVFVVGADGRVAVAPVTVGPIADGIAVIEKGLDDGRTVVVRGQYRLAPGTAVAPTPFQAGSGS
ncbi:efflux RND transporter periplasmic adaptor subunit [Ancylobacter defluvii]|uniref:Multidrug resistance protein n=1 Tax=Ancylobacter defluvii TaxID=1282440 RepID=A0A9W6N888_9HYPH|nr:efflux RND transporter periplasmic adaptor subunit [Ancylobacter defluvii]MBS7587399.1 efflux RND transporter periplasmic adaptor subunit [Ancylobacter defluvii]GLK82089.1 multidrug resistance protein [Ancylobacter defluvii]